MHFRVVRFVGQISLDLFVSGFLVDVLHAIQMGWRGVDQVGGPVPIIRGVHSADIGRCSSGNQTSNTPTIPRGGGVREGWRSDGDRNGQSRGRFVL